MALSAGLASLTHTLQCRVEWDVMGLPDRAGKRAVID